MLNTNQSISFAHKAFVMVHSGQGGEMSIQATDQELRIFLIEVPTEVEYP
ncbi:hypothetical protein [Domibacillus aminovorans]|nr:hypothetical protein [Domibacillus aminovorans]